MVADATEAAHEPGRRGIFSQVRAAVPPDTRLRWFEESKMKRIVMGSVLVLALVWTSAAEAKKPLGPKVPKKALKVGASLKAPKKPFTAADLGKRVKGFDLKKKFKTPSGKEITGQEYLDLVNQLQAAAEEGGCELGSGKACNFIVDDAKLSSDELKGTVKKAQARFKFRRLKAAGADKTLGNDGVGKDGVGKDGVAKGRKPPLGFSWEHDWGNPKKAAVYVGAEFGNGGSTTSSACGGAAYAGVHLFKNKREILRLEGEVNSAGSAVSGDAELFLMGQSVWSQGGTMNVDRKFEQSFRVSQSWSYWGIVTLNLKAKVTANATLKADLRGTARANEASCALTVTPGANVSVDGEAEVALLGYGPVSAAAVGVDAELTLADLRMPVIVSGSAENTNGKVLVRESIDARLELGYLSGSLDAYFKTDIPLNGEKVWDWDTNKFSFTLLEWDGNRFSESLFRQATTQPL